MSDERGSLLHRHLLLVQALCDPRTHKGDCQVLAVIAGHANATGEAWPGVLRIAKLASVHRTSVPRSVKRLEQLGYLEVDRRLGKANVYLLAETSSADAASTSSADAASKGSSPAAPVHATGSVYASRLAAPVLPNQQHPRCPNSAFELSSSNSEKRTQQPAALSIDDWVKQRPEPESPEQQQERLQEEEQKRAQRRDSIRSEYLGCRLTHPKHAELMERTFPKELADLIPACEGRLPPLVA